MEGDAETYVNVANSVFCFLLAVPLRRGRFDLDDSLLALTEGEEVYVMMTSLPVSRCWSASNTPKELRCVEQMLTRVGARLEWR